jgi:hypothetical protein
MDAVRVRRVGLAAWVAVVLFWCGGSAAAQNARSKNFLVHAPNQALAEAVAENAERFRNELAEYWLGRRLPDWPTPCPIEVVAGPRLAAQGVTTYTRSPVGNFQMEVVGTPERILDSVLPHEVTHTVLATHFGRPLPRWADEGICTTVEHSAERNKHEAKLREFLSTRRGIAMNRLFLLTEYPADMLPMYAQGYSVCRFLIEQSGPRRFIKFLEDYMRNPSWTANVQAHYGYESLEELQQKWLGWVADGSRSVESFVSTRSRQSASLAQAGAGEPRQRPQASLASSQAGSRPDRPAQDGWYKRRHQQTLLAGTAPKKRPQPPLQPPRSGNSPSTVLAPPSVTGSNYYLASQPQEEQSYGQVSAAPGGP